MVDYLRGRWWSRSSPSTPDYWHRHLLLLLQKVFWLFCFASASFSKLYINLTLSILYQFSFFCTLSRSAHAKDQGGKYDSWNTEDFDNSTNGIFRKVLALFDVNRFGHIMQLYEKSIHEICQKDSTTTLFEVTKIAPKYAYFATFANSRQKCVNGLKREQTTWKTNVLNI